MVNANGLWHKHGVMPPRTGHRPPTPLDTAKLDDLALRYVGRFATSRSKLIAYLQRKLRERGWTGDAQPDLAHVADRLVKLGYIDDASFALAKARALGARGFGARRVGQALQAAGIDEDDRVPAKNLANTERVAAAIRFARRRRLGPYANERPDPVHREKGLAAMIRAGHGFALSRAIVDLPPDSAIDEASLEELR